MVLSYILHITLAALMFTIATLKITKDIKAAFWVFAGVIIFGLAIGTLISDLNHQMIMRDISSMASNITSRLSK